MVCAWTVKDAARENIHLKKQKKKQGQRENNMYVLHFSGPVMTYSESYDLNFQCVTVLLPLQ